MKNTIYTVLGWLLLTIFSSLSLSASDSGPFNTKDISSGISVIIGPAGSGNVLLLTGEDGNIIIDDQVPNLATALHDIIKKKTGKKVEIVLNTHWHHDHVGGNEIFGGEGAIIIAHNNVRDRLMSAQKVLIYDMPALSKQALPKITFARKLEVHLNGQQISIVHAPNGHSDSDAMFFFSPANIVHMGDLFINETYPLFDLSNGGSVQGVLSGLKVALNRINDKTIVIPGHGPITNKKGLSEYYHFLNSSLASVAKMKNEGKSLKEIQNSNFLDEFNAIKDGGMISHDKFVSFLYETLK